MARGSPEQHVLPRRLRAGRSSGFDLPPELKIRAERPNDRDSSGVLQESPDWQERSEVARRLIRKAPVVPAPLMIWPRSRPVPELQPHSVDKRPQGLLALGAVTLMTAEVSLSVGGSRNFRLSGHR